MNLEQFFREHPSLSTAAFTSREGSHHSTLFEEVRHGANRGLRIFPVSLLAKLEGNPDLLIAEATSDVSRLAELAAEYPMCGWRATAGPSSLCILQLDGPVGRNSFATLSQDQEECLTLQACRGDAAWAFFRWPQGLVLRASAKKLAPGVRILADGDSCAVAPFLNPWAEIEAVPNWLRDLPFETPDISVGNAAPALYPCPTRCPRSTPPFVKLHRSARRD